MLSLCLCVCVLLVSANQLTTETQRHRESGSAKLSARSLRYGFEAFDELFEAFIGSQRVEDGFDADQDKSRMARFECLVQVLKSVVLVFQSRIHDREVQRRYVTLLRQCLQLVDDLLRLRLLTRHRIRKPERSRRLSVARNRFIRHWPTRRRLDQGPQLLDRIVVHSLLHVSQREVMPPHPKIGFS